MGTRDIVLRWVVHPLHRALIAEVILEQVCGVTCEHLVPNQQQQPQQVPHERVRLSLDLCNADRRYNHSLMREHQVLFGNLERSFRVPGIQDYGSQYLRQWFQQTREAIIMDHNNHNTANHPVNNLSNIQRDRIQHEGLFPLIWMFRDTGGQPIESAIGFGSTGGPHNNDHGDPPPMMEACNWSSYVDDHEIASLVPGRKFWNVVHDCDARSQIPSLAHVHSVVDLFCLGMGSDGCNGMEFVVGRLAWAVAHKIHPTLLNVDVVMWEELIEGVADQVEELPERERSLALAAIRQEIPLAVASDYL
jgi:hypothetical protein